MHINFRVKLLVLKKIHDFMKSMQVMLKTNSKVM